MSGFEIAFAAGQLLTLLATLPTLLDPRAYVPRKTSGYLQVGLALMVMGLLGIGVYLGAIITGLVALAWTGIYIWRGDRNRALH